MKKTGLLLLISLILMIGLTVNAQMNHRQNKQQHGMMQDGMMNNGMCPMNGKMMGQDMPLKKYGMMVNRLPNMQQQLSLNDNQIEELYDLQAKFKKQQIDFELELRKKRMKLKNLLDEMASSNQVEKQMQDCAETKISIKVAAYETAGKMKAVLNSDQKEQLKNTMMQHDGMMNQSQGGMMHKRGKMMHNQKNK